MSSSSRISRCRVPICCIVIAALSACGHEQVRRLPSADPGSGTRVVIPDVRKRNVGEQAAVVAIRQVGVPYKFGGSTTRGFDCSGLVQYAYAHVGKNIPRTTVEQWRRLTPVSSNNIRVGDLLFFRIDGSISHVGLYLGNRRFVHAPSSGQDVRTASLDSDYYRRTFVRAGRPN